MACLDTTVLIDLISKNTGLRTRAFSKVGQLLKHGQELMTTRFNVAELYVGAARCRDSSAEHRVIDNLLSDIGIIEFNDRSARLFGQITAFLQSVGKPAGDMDVLIASTALAYGHILVTRNRIHFANIPELVVEEY
jgi:predicted nucleic acid-binding protein